MDCKRVSSFLTAAILVINNEDLLIQILVFLPRVILLKFQLVNKKWCSIICSDHFRKLYTLYTRFRPKSLPSFIICSIGNHHYNFNPVARTFNPVRFNFPYTYVLHACNGLLLLEWRNKQYGRKDIYVYNPTTSQSRMLTLSKSLKDLKATVAGLVLVFDPFESPNYKVVCIWKIASRSHFRVEVFDSGTQLWQLKSAKPLSSSRFKKFNKAVYWKGEVYWIRPSATSYVLDLESGEFRTPPAIKPPSRKTGQMNKNYVIESNGHLHCVSYYSRQVETSMLVFEMNGDKSGWFQKYSVNLNPAVLDDFVEVVGIVRGETEEESAVLFHVPGRIICYSFFDRSLKLVLDLENHKNEIHEYNENRLMIFRNFTWQFIETLVPV